MEGINQAVATTAPASSAMPTGSAPSAASPSAMSAGLSYQASPTTVQAPAAPAPVYQQQAAPAAQGNPWQEAFQALSASLNTPSQSQAQAPYSAYQTPTPQASFQAPLGSIQQQQQAQYSAPQTFSPQASTPAYSEQVLADQAQLAALAQAQYLSSPSVQQAQAAGSASDSYLSQVSDTSLEVLEHFGAEAPALLNEYACAVEDALIEQVKTGQAMNLMLNAAGEERAAMNIMLTDPDILADYVNDFFGANGPYPTETAEEAAASAAHNARAQFEAEIAAQEQRQVPAAFQRPQMEMPTPGQAPGNDARNFWNGFSEMMDSSPENAWKYLSQAPGAAFQTKALIQDM